MIDKKFGKFIGINLERAEQMTDDEVQKLYNNEKRRFLFSIKSFLNSTGREYESICAIIKNLENYEYDCRVAIFMLLGVQHAGYYKIKKIYSHWPFDIRKKANILKTTAWCSAFQQVIIKDENLTTFDVDAPKDSSLNRFNFRRLKKIEKELAIKIEEDQTREFELEAKLTENSSQGLLSDYEFFLCATKNRKENWIFEDMILGKSISFTIYYWMQMITQKDNVSFEIFAELIRILSSLKCFQFRNIIVGVVFEMLLAQNNFSERNIKSITEKIKGLVGIVNRYYKALLILKWRETMRNSKLKDKSYRNSFMDIEANSLDFYIEDGNTTSYLVERSISRTNGIYRAKLESDLKKLYEAEYEYEKDKDLLTIEGLPVFLISGSVTADEKRKNITHEENKKIEEGEEERKTTTSTQKIMSNASALFTYIHWEVMKTNKQ